MLTFYDIKNVEVMTWRRGLFNCSEPIFATHTRLSQVNEILANVHYKQKGKSDIGSSKEILVLIKPSPGPGIGNYNERLYVTYMFEVLNEKDVVGDKILVYPPNSTITGPPAWISRPLMKAPSCLNPDTSSAGLTADHLYIVPSVSSPLYREG